MSIADDKPTLSLDDDWGSINEAARRLGVTATAIRNRIKRARTMTVTFATPSMNSSRR